MNELNSIISRQINDSDNPWISNFKITSNLDNENILKNYQIEEPIKNNNIYNFLLVIPRKK